MVSLHIYLFSLQLENNLHVLGKRKLSVCVELLIKLRAAGEPLHETFSFALFVFVTFCLRYLSLSVLDVEPFESH